MNVSWVKERQEISVLAERFPRLCALALDDETAIKYTPQFREFSVPVIDGGIVSSGILLEFDPWTGAALPSPLRDEWFDAIVTLGFPDSLESLFDKALPAEFRSEAWWVRLGL